MRRVIPASVALILFLAASSATAYAADPPAATAAGTPAWLPAGPAVATTLQAPEAASPTGNATAVAAAPVSADDDDDLEPQATQPDFTLVNLPTTLRLPQHKLAFRVAHRFTRALNQDSFRNSLSDAFGLDSGAQIGLELRFSPIRGAQAGVFRGNNKTIDFFGEYNLLRQSDHMPLSVSAIGAIEGTENFTGSYSPSIGASVGLSLGKVAALYVIPMWINNTNTLPSELVDSNNTVLLGLGARVRLLRHTYIVAEASPRVSGFKGAYGQGANEREGMTVGSFAIEEQVGGHVFQINFSNAFALTPANLARGATPGKTNWYLGFNISRKFY